MKPVFDTDRAHEIIVKLFIEGFLLSVRIEPLPIGFQDRLRTDNYLQKKIAEKPFRCQPYAKYYPADHISCAHAQDIN